MTNDREVSFPIWLAGRLGDEGWTTQVLGTFGAIEVIEFTKAAGTPPSA